MGSAGEQLIAANVDTLFIVSSLNEDFNLNRIERYLSLANEAQTVPVIILSKADLCDDAESLCRQVQALDPLLMVESINCLNTDEIVKLEPWCGTGKTVALMGRSKSDLQRRTGSTTFVQLSETDERAGVQ